MQIFSKNFVILSVLLFNHLIFFGMMSEDQKICDDVIIYVARNSDGEVKNLLQKTNKYFNGFISQKNDNFLLSLDPASITIIDRENIWLRTNNKKVEEHFRPSKEIFIRSCFTDASYIKQKEKVIHFKAILKEISLERIENVKWVIKNIGTIVKNNVITGAVEEQFHSKLFPNSVNNYRIANMYEGIKLLQLVSLLEGNNSQLMSFVFLFLKLYDIRSISFSQRNAITRVLLEECMRRDNKETFKLIVQNDPLYVLNDLETLEKSYNGIHIILSTVKGVHVTRKALFCDICRASYEAIKK